MLAAVIKITSKLSVARSPLDIQIILIIYRPGTVNINFTIYGQQTHSHRHSIAITNRFSRANTCFRCTFCTLGIFICSFTVFTGFEQQKNYHLGASSLFYNLISRGFRVWNLEFLFSLKTIAFAS